MGKILRKVQGSCVYLPFGLLEKLNLKDQDSIEVVEVQGGLLIQKSREGDLVPEFNFSGWGNETLHRDAEKYIDMIVSSMQGLCKVIEGDYKRIESILHKKGYSNSYYGFEGVSYKLGDYLHSYGGLSSLGFYLYFIYDEFCIFTYTVDGKNPIRIGSVKLPNLIREFLLWQNALKIVVSN